MAVVSGTIGTIATYVGAAAAAAGAITAKQSADYQAKVYEQQAEQERVAAAEKERDFRKQQAAQLGEYRAAAGASGVSLTSGSPLASFVDFTGETELQADRIRRAGGMTSTRLLQSADLSRMAGTSKAIEGFGRAGSTLLAGYTPKPRAVPTVSP